MAPSGRGACEQQYLHSTMRLSDIFGSASNAALLLDNLQGTAVSLFVDVHVAQGRAR